MESIRSCGKSICKTVWFSWYSIRAGIINFVVLIASSCNSGIFANSRTLFGLGRKQGPPFLHKTNKHGVPYYAILLTCGLLSIAIILNAVFKDATKVFVQITTFSTVLNIMIWTCIMIAYLGFVKRNPELHNDSKFKMPGGKYMAYAILVFFAFIFIVLLINSTTRFLCTIRACLGHRTCHHVSKVSKRI